METNPYFCPNCTSNRVKFRFITTYSQDFFKDAATGEIMETWDNEPVFQNEATIQCRVCDFIGNEMRFIKQAEREPRIMTTTQPIYK